jgi:hypothetical protein
LRGQPRVNASFVLVSDSVPELACRPLLMVRRFFLGRQMTNAINVTILKRPGPGEQLA